MKKQSKAMLLEDDGVDAGNVSLTVNEEFAQRFEHNARRAELHRLKEKHPEQYARLQARALAEIEGEVDDGGDFADESTSEEEDDGIIEPDTERQILQTLKKLRKKDPEIYDPTKRFFPSTNPTQEDQDEHGSQQAGKQGKRQKRMLLKDVLFKQRMEEAATGFAEDSDQDADGHMDAKQNGSLTQRPRQAYDAEQEQLRASFMQAAEGGAALDSSSEDDGVDDDEDGLLQPKQGSTPTKISAAVPEELLAEVFDAEDEKDRFLREYIQKQAWLDKEDDYDFRVGPTDDLHGDGTVDPAPLEQAEEFEEQAEEFEHQYNFRFEEPGGTSLVSHPRDIASIRKTDTRRAEQRKRREERKAAEEQARREELKRLKNLKKQEIEERMLAIKKMAGKVTEDDDAVDALLLQQMLEGDFDPEKYDQLMAKAFGEEYYNAEVAEDEADLAVIAGMNEEDGELADEEEDDMDEDVMMDEQAEQIPAKLMALGDGKGEAGPLTFKQLRRKLKQNAEGREVVARSRAEVQQLLDEYYKLDYEDHVGGVYTRFRYKPVSADTFGLEAGDILALEDRELNQILSLKKLAPYREDAEGIRPNPKALQRIVGRKRRAEAVSANGQTDIPAVRKAGRKQQGSNMHAGRDGARDRRTGRQQQGAYVQPRRQAVQKSQDGGNLAAGSVEGTHSQQDVAGVQGQETLASGKPQKAAKRHKAQHASVPDRSAEDKVQVGRAVLDRSRFESYGKPGADRRKAGHVPGARSAVNGGGREKQIGGSSEQKKGGKYGAKEKKAGQSVQRVAVATVTKGVTKGVKLPAGGDGGHDAGAARLEVHIQPGKELSKAAMKNLRRRLKRKAEAIQRNNAQHAAAEL